MKIVKIQSVIFILISFLGFQTSSFAQTMDNPMPLTEGALTVNSSSQATDYYYTFETQVGEIIITGDGMGNAGVFFVGLLNTDFQNIKSSEQFFSGTPTRRKVMRINIGKAQKVLLKVKAPKSTNASLKLRIEGAVQFGSSPVVTETNTQMNTQTTPTDNGQTTNYTPQTQSETQQETQSETQPQTTDNQTPNTEFNTLRKVIVTLKNGQVLEGSFSDLQVVSMGDKKMTLTLRSGKNLPQITRLGDIKSITID